MSYKDALSAKEAAAYAGMSYQAFKKAVTRSSTLMEGRVPVGERAYLYPLDVLREWLDETGKGRS